MGTFATIVIVAPPNEGPSVVDSVRRIVDGIEMELSVLSGGPVHRLNAEGGLGLADRIHLARLLAASDSLHEITGGLFDPSIGAVVELWGFPDRPSVPDSASLDSILRRHTGWSGVSWTEDSVMLAEGIHLDFGAIAKGYAVDMAYEKAVELGAQAVLVEIGGEVRCGSSASCGRIWRVGVKDPRAEGVSTVLAISEGSVATSGDYECRFHEDGESYCHLIDPRSGWPETGVASATVISERCVDADAIATALSVGGVEAAEGLPEGACRAILIVFEDENGETHEWRSSTWKEKWNG
jgi:thiamine biosynthesis lipoprotein